jgi:pyrroloquinoline quinone biosynthesis protein B
MKRLLALAAIGVAACSANVPAPDPAPDVAGTPFVIVLGTAQDGGYPQAGCAKACCERAWADPAARRFVASLGLVDSATGARWVFDATPDFRDQLRLLDSAHPVDARPPGLSGIFLTHAHVGHYTGLMMLGREAIGASRVPVHALPRMRSFLEANGPWDQLVRLGNVVLEPLEEGGVTRLTDAISVTTLVVPHRDEYSETAAFVISGPTRSVLFVPDIDKWETWETSIEDLVRQVDVAYVDGTFFENGEIPGRDMSEIPHPFIEESMARFASLPAEERAKVRFIHLNHTNPALQPDSPARRRIEAAGFRVAEQGERAGL